MVSLLRGQCGAEVLNGGCFVPQGIFRDIFDYYSWGDSGPAGGICWVETRATSLRSEESCGPNVTGANQGGEPLVSW